MCGHYASPSWVGKGLLSDAERQAKAAEAEEEKEALMAKFIEGYTVHDEAFYRALAKYEEQVDADIDATMNADFMDMAFPETYTNMEFPDGWLKEFNETAQICYNVTLNKDKSVHDGQNYKSFYT